MHKQILLRVQPKASSSANWSRINSRPPLAPLFNKYLWSNSHVPGTDFSPSLKRLIKGWGNVLRRQPGLLWETDVKLETSNKE